MAHPRNRGFTLIEVLTVIAILAVLAALLFPVFANARRSAKKASATSNVRQLAMAQLMYAADADDKPTVFCGFCPIQPSYPHKKFLVTGPEIWMVLLLPYVGHTSEPTRPMGAFLPEDLPRIFFDPNEPFVRFSDWPGCSQFSTVTSWGISDAIVNFLGTSDSPGRDHVRTLSSFGSPSSTILLAQTYQQEHCMDLELPGHALAVPAWHGLHGWSASTTVDGIYPGDQNLVAMLDGSVRLMPRAKLTESMQYWDDAWQP